MRVKLLGAIAVIALATALAHLLWREAPGRSPDEPDATAADTTPLRIPRAKRSLRLGREARNVAVDRGEVMRLELPSDPSDPTVATLATVGRGQEVRVGYAHLGRDPQPAVLEVSDTSTPNLRVLQRIRLNPGTGGWRDLRLSIPAGVTRLSLEVVSEQPGARPPPLVLSQPALVAGGTPGSRANLVLVSIDTLRPDFLNTYGYADQLTSPNIDRWAEGGAVFEQAIAPSAWTLPSHSAVFTGFDPDGMGMDRVLTESPRLPLEKTTLAELFQQAGYLTVAFTGGGPVGTRNGFGDGFYLYRENHYDLRRPDLEDTLRFARDWLRENGAEPFFVFLHTFEVHAPYKYDQFATPDLDHRARRRAMYASGVAQTDRLLAEFLDFLESEGLMSNTLVVLMSDHGEGFVDEHGMLEHGRTLYDEVVRVPLILFGPGIPTARIPQQVPLQDLFATLVDYFELPPPDGIDSVSLLPALAGEDTRDRTAYLCCMAHDFQRKGLRKNGLKYIRSEDPAVATGPVEELFDLTSDPGESRDLSRTMTSALRSMRRETLIRAARNAERSQGTEALEIDETYREQLRALGYVE